MDYLKLTREKTKSTTVVSAIYEVLGSIEALKTITSSVHSAFYEAEKAAIRTKTPDHNAANLANQEAILKICEDLKSCVNKQQEDINVLKITQAAPGPSYALKAGVHRDTDRNLPIKNDRQNTKIKASQQVQYQQQNTAAECQADHEDETG